MKDDYHIATRQSLLDRLKSLEDQRSWQEFFDTYWHLIYGVANKAGLTEEEAQDVVQDTVISVARSLPEFQYDSAKCSFKSWLLNVTRWKIVGRLRQRQVGKPQAGWVAFGEEDAPLPEEVPDPAGCEFERLWDAEWSARLTDMATQRLKRQVSPKQFQIFYLHVLREVPVREVARRLGVSMGQVYLVKHRVARSFRRVLQALQGERAAG